MIGLRTIAVSLSLLTTTRSTVIFQELTIVQLVNKFPVYDG
jgi:hypothetical protein